jgi:hypothetical protein
MRRRDDRTNALVEVRISGKCALHDLEARIDEAYQQKYRRYAKSIVDSTSRLRRDRRR